MIVLSNALHYRFTFADICYFFSVDQEVNAAHPSFEYSTPLIYPKCAHELDEKHESRALRALCVVLFMRASQHSSGGFHRVYFQFQTLFGKRMISPPIRCNSYERS